MVQTGLVVNTGLAYCLSAAGHELINTVLYKWERSRKTTTTNGNKNMQNTVLAASAHVLPFFFLCLSLIVGV